MTSTNVAVILLAAGSAASAAHGGEAAENDPRWHGIVRWAVAQYESWGRIDDEARWAPWLCRMPTPALARFSASGDSQTHGSKLYTVSALDPVAYGARAGFGLREPSPPPDGGVLQALVKESFHPRAIEGKPGSEPTRNAGARGLRPATRGGRLYEAGEPAGLYLMVRMRDAAPETDAGWIYATVMPDRATITSAGRSASCMRCHVEAGPGRLFGLPSATRAE